MSRLLFRSVLLLAAAVCCLGARVAATAPQHAKALRATAFGRVVGASGEPWVGAEVHLLHYPITTIRDEGYSEHQVVQTDERGQFRCQVMVGCAYRAWALGATEADGGYAISGVARAAVARTPILLRHSHRQFVRRVLPKPDASWNGRGLRYRASIEGSGRYGFAQWVSPDADGVLTLPRWPHDYIMVQAWSEGWMVCRFGLTATVDYATRFGLEFRSDQAKPDADQAAHALHAVYERALPPRRVVPVVIRAADTGKPVVGATVRTEFQPRSCPAPRSGPDGVLRVVSASEEEHPSKPPARCCLAAPDRRERDLELEPFVALAQGEPDPDSEADGAPRFVCRMWPGRTVAAKLTMAGQPFASMPAMLEASVGSGPDGAWFGIEPRVFVSDADGALSLPGRSERFPYRLTAALTASDRAKLASLHDPLPTARGGADRDAMKGAPVAPLAVLRWEDAGVPEDLGEIAIDRLLPIEITVRQPDGTPPGATRVLLIRIAVSDDAPSSPLTVYTDHRGRVRVLAPSCEDVLVHAITSQGAAWRRLTAGDRRCALDIDARHLARFRLVGPDGNPLANARLHHVCPDAYGGPGGEEVDPDVLRAVRKMCMVNALAGQGCRTGADGYGQMVAPLLGTSFDFAVHVQGADSKRTHLFWNGPTRAENGEVAVPVVRVR
ncbi:MAG: hypothetical protein AB8H80_12170 [Planctomycetota bacterium]